MKTLSPKIIDRLSKELSISEKTIRNHIGSLSKSYPNSTLNARAYLYASKKDLNLYNLLDNEDKRSLPSTSTAVNVAPSNQKGFRVIVQGDKESHWLLKLILGSLILAVIAGTISQILGTYLTNLFGIPGK